MSKIKTIRLTWKQLQNICINRSGIDNCYHPRRKSTPYTNWWDLEKVCYRAKDCPIFNRRRQ